MGGTLMTRIDGVAYLMLLPLLAAVGWLAARNRDERSQLLRIYVAVVVGVLPPAILGTIDVQRRSGPYYHALHHQVWELYAVLGLSTLVAIVGDVLPACARRSRDLAGRSPKTDQHYCCLGNRGRVGAGVEPATGRADPSGQRSGRGRGRLGATSRRRASARQRRMPSNRCSGSRGTSVPLH